MGEQLRHTGGRCGAQGTEEWLAGKPKWREYMNWPVSFALVWTT